MAKEIAVSAKGKSGLSSKESKEVITALRQARTAGEIPGLSFEYNPHPKLFGVERVAVQVRTALRKRFVNKYSVYLV